MEWLSDIIGVGASAASGGLFGLVGAGLSAFFKSKQEKERRLEDADKRSHELALHELNIRAGQQETENEIALANQEGSWSGLSTSIQAASDVGRTHKWVNDIKSLFRPFLTVTLWGLAGWVFYQVADRGLDALTQAEVNELVKYMVLTVFFCASTATTWWFGDRALTPPGLKNK